MTVTDAYWTPKLHDNVWMNQPDSPRGDKPLGRVVGFVPEDAGPRAGQPIIECLEDEQRVLGTGRKKGDRFVCHPMFLLPFPYLGEEWKRAMAEGRIVG